MLRSTPLQNKTYIHILTVSNCFLQRRLAVVYVISARFIDGTEVQTLLHRTSLSYRLCSERIPPARPPWSSPASSPPQGRCVISCSSARTGSKHAACSSFLLTERRWQQGRKENTVITCILRLWRWQEKQQLQCAVSCPDALGSTWQQASVLTGNRKEITGEQMIRKAGQRGNRGLNYRLLLPSFPTASPTQRPSFSQPSPLLA